MEAAVNPKAKLAELGPRAQTEILAMSAVLV